MQAKITQFFISKGFSSDAASAWQEKPNTQRMLSLVEENGNKIATVNFYASTGKVLWQGKRGSELQREFEKW